MKMDESKLQLSPVTPTSFATKSRVNESSVGRKSEIFCNVRHMLDYIDEVERENYRHAKAIEDRFRAIKHELNYRLMEANSAARLDVSTGSDRNQWEPLFGEIEHDLQLNRMAMNGIDRNLARLRTRFEYMKRSDNSGNQLPKWTSTGAAVAFKTPLTNPIAHKSATSSIVCQETKSLPSPEVARWEPNQSSVTPADMFKVPTFIPRGRKRKNVANDEATKRKLTEEQNKFESIIEATKFWQMELDPNSSYHQRFANIIHGLPKGNVGLDPKEIQKAIAWIDE